jgi:replicative DNA helicase
MGGVPRLAEIFGAYVATKDDLGDYIKTVKNYSLYRVLELLSKRISALLEQKDTKNASEMLREIKKMIDIIDENIEGKLGSDFFDLKKEFVDELRKKMSDDCPEVYLSTGIDALDMLTGGIEGGKLITIAARPGIGKTVLAINMAVKMAKAHKPVYFFSIEMVYKEILDRVYSQLSSVDHQSIRMATLTEYDFEQIVKAGDEIDKTMLLIDDEGGIKIDDIVSKSKRAKEVFNISAIFVDYLELITSKDKPEYRRLEIESFTRTLKALAKKLNIPVICLAQLSRKVDDRVGHLPQLSDLKESGSIEQDSDLVIALSRRDAYDEHDRPGEAQVYILKNRHGPTGNVRLRFDKEHSQFIEIL